MGQPGEIDSVASLDSDMARKNLSGYWRLGMEGLPNYPMTSVQPCLWKWQDVHDSLVRAGEVINLENSERRVVRLVNPGLDRKHAFEIVGHEQMLLVRTESQALRINESIIRQKQLQAVAVAIELVDARRDAVRCEDITIRIQHQITQPMRLRLGRQQIFPDQLL